MKLLTDFDLNRRNSEFEIVAATPRCQVAVMVLQAGENSGEYGNEHAGSDQLVYVTEGQGLAIVNGQELKLREDDVILIQAGEQHQIRAAGKGPLRTLNVYSPPGY